MAVAEKKIQETSTSSIFDRVQVVSLVGVVYVVAAFAIIFKLVPSLIGAITVGMNVFMGNSLLVLAVVAAAVGLIIVGVRLLGPKQQPGVRAGILMGLLFLIGVLLMSRWVSLWVEHWVYYQGWFGEAGQTVGIVITSLAGIGFLYLALRWFLKPGFERFLVGFESAGWFSTSSYKPQQGQKVRRGTILGILLIFGAGIYTMITHNILARGSSNWEIGIPFTGTINDIAANDAADQLTHDYPNWENGGVPAYEFRKVVAEFDPSKYVRIDTPYDEITVSYLVGSGAEQQTKSATFKKNARVPRSEILELKKNIEYADRNKLPDADEAKKLGIRPVVVPSSPPTGRMDMAAITLLPHVRFTLPFVLLVLALWFAWRVVNLPSFADFLIATEAELNKVSWTTRRRLWQDTIVVLTTLVLMAVLLFGMDQLWLHLLSWKRVGVIYQDETQSQSTKGEKPSW